MLTIVAVGRTGPVWAAIPDQNGSVAKGAARADGVLTVTLFLENDQLGEIALYGSQGGAVAVAKAALIDMLLPALDTAALARLEQLPERKGLVTLGQVQAAGFSVGHDRRQLRLARIQAKPPAGTFTGMTYDVALTSGGEPLGVLTVRYSARTLLLPKAVLLDMLAPVLDPRSAVTRALAQLPEKDGHVSLTAVEGAGFQLKVNQNRIDLTPSKLPGPANTASGVPAPGAGPTESPHANMSPIEGSQGAVRLSMAGEIVGELTAQRGPGGEVLLEKAPFIDMITPVLDGSSDLAGKGTSEQPVDHGTLRPLIRGGSRWPTN